MNGGSAGVGGGAGGTGGSPEPTTHVVVEAYQQDFKPVPDADVVVSNSDGTFVSRHKAGQDGAVDVVVPPDGTVSAFKKVDYVQSDGVRVQARGASTVLRVGDHPEQIYVELFNFDPQPPPPVDPTPMTVTVNATSSEPGADAYWDVWMPCRNYGTIHAPAGSGSVTMQVKPCTGEQVLDIWVFVRKADELVRYGTLLDEPFVAGGTKTVNIAANKISFSDHEFNITAIPSGATEGSVRVFPRRVNRDTSLDLGRYIHPPGPEEVLSLRIPQESFKDVTTTLGISLPQNRSLSAVRIGQVAPAQMNWAAATVLSPFSTSTTVGLTTSRPEVAWQLDGSAVGDAIWGSLHAYDGTNGMVVWDFVAPPAAAGTMKLPSLPSDLEQFITSPPDNRYVTLLSYDAIATTGYDQVIAKSAGFHEPNGNYSSIYFDSTGQ
ncbi:MAG: hypothetical protein R3B89_05440 [Polyangiaceae bacterium]